MEPRRLMARALICAIALSPSSGRAGWTVLHAFGATDGQIPSGPPLVAQDGRILGTTRYGGAFGFGTVYAIEPDGSNYATLHDFSGPDGANPLSSLAQDADGTIVGSAPTAFIDTGGTRTFFNGAVFAMSSDGGAFATLHRFELDGPEGGGPGQLVDGGDGWFYATMASGGPDRVGSVIRIAQDGSVQTLHAYTPPGRSFPDRLLTLAGDGRLYGVTTMSARGQFGAVFSMQRDGTDYRLLHAFDGTRSGMPSGGLTELAGDLYGITVGGGSGRHGTVFRLTRGGAVTPVHAFDGDDGHSPMAPLALGPDGNLYGVTHGDEDYRRGTLFRVTPQGDFMTLHLLDRSGGEAPESGPAFAADGALYGTTSAGGVGHGVLYRFDALAAQPGELAMTKLCNKSPTGCGTPSDVHVGQRYSVVWQSANLDACTASGAWNGSRPVDGHLETIALHRGTYVYRLDCIGPDGRAASASISVTVGR